MILEQSKQIIEEVNKAFIGKNDIIEKVLMTIYAGGHILLEDCPGVGKTTLAMAFSKVLGLSSKRIQFTPDTPSLRSRSPHSRTSPLSASSSRSATAHGTRTSTSDSGLTQWS